ncbi:MAG: MFS transporter [Methanofollis sp.]|uniref:MFS transporter n=1 Tax=Methanofollis sp. TaxID=2052835 RepID=UPI002604C26D|nr:MFS transporter [Methanofollis sp.]MDD4254166.1 MFS transporter [Methanofollis sp.]
MLLALLCTAAMVVMAGEAMLIAAFPVIESEFGVSSVFTAWILPAMMIVGAMTIPAVGVLGDRYGKKRLLIICLSIYAAGAICGGFAQDMLSLLCCRALQGAGLAVGPIACALIAEQVPERLVPSAIGLVAATDGAGTFAGVLAGAYIVEQYSWQTCYHWMAPVAVLLVLAAAIIVRPSPVRGGRGVDLAGTALFSLAILGGMIALSLWDPSGLPGPSVAALFALALGALVLFLHREGQADDPVFNAGFFLKSPVRTVCINDMVVMLLFFLLLQSMPYIIESPAGLGLTAFSVGLIMVPGTVADMISGAVAGRIVQKKGFQFAFIIGALEIAVGCGLLIVFPLSVPVLVLVWIAISAGMSVLLTVDNIVVVAAAPPDKLTTASALIHTLQSVGGTLGPLITGIALAGHSGAPAGTAFTTIFAIGGAIAVLVLVQAGLVQGTAVESPGTERSTREKPALFSCSGRD